MRARSGGFSLIEVVIAMAIMGAVVLMVWGLLATVNKEVGNQAIHMKLEETTRRVIDDIAKEFRGSGSTVTTDEADRLGSSDPFYSASNADRFVRIRFSLPTGMNLGTKTTQPSLTYDRHVTYAWIPRADDGLDDADNNKNGYVDEGQIVKIEETPSGTRTTVLADLVPERGLSFQYTNSAAAKDDVTVFLKLAAIDTTKKMDLSKTPPQVTLVERELSTAASRRAR